MLGGISVIFNYNVRESMHFKIGIFYGNKTMKYLLEWNESFNFVFDRKNKQNDDEKRKKYDIRVHDNIDITL